MIRKLRKLPALAIQSILDANVTTAKKLRPSVIVN